jgi:Phage integrase, N-terminal SAM-like domain
LFEKNYQLHLKHLKLKGLQPKTIEAYSRAIRRIGQRFAHRIDTLTRAQLTDYFSELVGSHAALDEETRADPVPLLWGGDGDRQDPDSIRVLGPLLDSDSHPGNTVTM